MTELKLFADLFGAPLFFCLPQPISPRVSGWLAR